MQSLDNYVSEMSAESYKSDGATPPLERAELQPSQSLERSTTKVSRSARRKEGRDARKAGKQSGQANDSRMVAQAWSILTTLELSSPSKDTLDLSKLSAQVAAFTKGLHEQVGRAMDAKEDLESADPLTRALGKLKWNVVLTNAIRGMNEATEVLTSATDSLHRLSELPEDLETLQRIQELQLQEGLTVEQKTVGMELLLSMLSSAARATLKDIAKDINEAAKAGSHSDAAI